MLAIVPSSQASHAIISRATEKNSRHVRAEVELTPPDTLAFGGTLDTIWSCVVFAFGFSR